MRQLQPVVWSKGTFLTPQHLQTRDRFLESVLQFRLEALNFCPWGFQELQLNREALAGGNFALTRAVGILPDGLPFDIPESDPAPAPKPLESFFEADQSTVDVYLAIPHHRERGLNVSIAQSNADTRYLSEVVNLRDENTGASEKPVQLARKNFRFLMEGESREGCTSLRVARIKRSAAGSLQQDPEFIPPLLDISASEFLVGITRRLVEILSAKSSILAGGRSQRSSGLADFTAADIAGFWLLYTVNSHLPVLRHFYETGRAHPEKLYRVVAALGGALSTFSLKIQPRDLPAYDHDGLGACFSDLDDKVRELLETVVPSNFVSLPLKPVQPSIYATAIEEDKYLVGTKMYLAVNSSLNQADLAKKVPQLVKISSATQVEQLVRRALPGVPLTHMAKPPASIPVKLSYEYFSLNQSGSAWDAVGRARSLAAYVPGDIPAPQLELIILLPQAL
ncbi:MAG TPA: type VI secretion system baseplate subunit TssK [Candidatus Acidoferrum sp.]|nr:type VI secretion system baseplate subunit TssK [Candidatus Acidoferrum sp.]